MITEHAAPSGLADFYATSYPRTLHLLVMACGNRAEAEEVLQEAFIRLIPRWDRVADYDSPEAWVRQVAFRLLRKRERVERTRAITLNRLARESSLTAPTLTPTRSDVEAALRRLPLPQRQAVILHYLVDMTVEQVAVEMGVRPGTVKSRLARARQALAPFLREA